MRAILLSLVFVLACGKDGGGGGGGGGDDQPAPDGSVTVPDGDPLSGLPTGTGAWTALCAKHYGDLISKAFCAGTAPPTLTSLADLRQLLGLTIDPANPQIGTSFSLVGHSTAISSRFVTPLNPRAILFTQPNSGGAPNPTYQVLAFSRGEPIVELAANDPTAGNVLRFFLVRFIPTCETAAAGCNFADLLTLGYESGWSGYSVYDDQAIGNTTLDCLQCHQPGGPGTTSMLRMQELTNPWTHWFYEERPANLQMELDFLAAHTGEDYAGIPSNLIRPSRPFRIEALVENNGFRAQPNPYPTQTIVDELAATGASATWHKLYANVVAGKDIAVPYFAGLQTDKTKVQAAISAYTGVRNGTLARDQMPDIRDTLLDAALSDMSYAPAAGLDGKGILVHMCQHCHNSSLDQSITRARFNVETLATLSRGEKDEAIARLQLGDDDRHKMPPARFHTLSAAERDLVIQELQK